MPRVLAGVFDVYGRLGVFRPRSDAHYCRSARQVDREEKEKHCMRTWHGRLDSSSAVLACSSAEVR